MLLMKRACPILIFFLLFFTLLSCEVTQKKVLPLADQIGITVCPSEITLEKGDSAQIEVTIIPTHTSLKASFKSSNPSIVAVSESGSISAISQGIAEVIVSVKSAIAKCIVTVVDKKEETIVHPIEYFCEYNLAPDGLSFMKNHSNEGALYIDYEEAVKKYTKVEIEGKKYHLPDKLEMSIIFPDLAIIEFGDGSKYDNNEETISVAGEVKQYNAFYRSVGAHTCYALRFIGNDNKWLSAWQYDYVENPSDNTGKYLVVTCRPLGPNFKGDINTVANKDFWTSNNEKDIVRYFPAAGFISTTEDGESKAPENVGAYGHYWTATSSSESMGENAYFNMYYVGIFINGKAIKLPVRLMKED